MAVVFAKLGWELSFCPRGSKVPNIPRPLSSRWCLGCLKEYLGGAGIGQILASSNQVTPDSSCCWDYGKMGLNSVLGVIAICRIQRC